MTLAVHRLGKLRYAQQLFSGLGGLHASGRWTSRGRRVVYTSESISLAVLEYTLNYRYRGWVPAFVLGKANIPGGVRIESVKTTDLPRDWCDPQPPSVLQEIGRRWLEKRRSAVLRVPSAIVTEEWNYLLNPEHPDFGKISFTSPKPFRFDRRLAGTRNS